MPDGIEVTAEAYHYDSEKQIHYVKIKLLGMYINGIHVKPSRHFAERGQWVQMPSYQQRGVWKRYIEFAADSELKQVIEDKCREAAQNYSPR